MTHCPPLADGDDLRAYRARRDFEPFPALSFFEQGAVMGVDDLGRIARVQSDLRYVPGFADGGRVLRVTQVALEAG